MAALIAHLDDAIRAERFEITDRQAVLAGQIRAEHRDPFDRMIAAQAMDLAVPVDSSDPLFTTLDVETIW